MDGQQPRREGETEVIPAVTSGEGIARTQELPVAEDVTTQVPAPVEPPAPTTPAAPTVPPPPVAAPPVAAPPVAAPPVAAPTAAVPPVPVPSVEQPPGGRSRAFWPLVAVLVIALAAGALAFVNRPKGGTAGSGGASPPAAAVALPAAVSSLDPSGGSGLRAQGGTWRTQTYASADFGNLKNGVGLLLDLGSPHAVSTVSFEVTGGAVTLQLRAGDERAAAESGYAEVTDPAAAAGATTLAAKDGGKHRYWLVWITRLAAQDGGYRAVLTTPALKGPAG